MKKILFMFPGQGSQAPGMGKDLYEKEKIIQDLFKEASLLSGRDMAALCFDTSEEELKKTENTQPALFLCSYAASLIAREKGITPLCTAGHSLGEYSAVAAAGMLTFGSAFNLVSVRGKLMSRAGQKRPGSMAAIIGLENDAVEAVCAEASKNGTVVPANYNSPGQIVVSGEIAGIKSVIELAKAKGAKRAIELQVSGAFHSPLMEDVVSEFEAVLNETDFSDTSVPIISNVSAQPVTKGSEMKKLLLQQLISPVRWTACVEKAVELGTETALEIGPGKVLSGLFRRISKDIPTFSIENTGNLASFISENL
jgi:[acyl-carrier-protein] S-malonyltransferase